MIFTTLNNIRERGPCGGGWAVLLRTLGKTQADDAPLSMIAILDSNGLDDAMWCLCALPPEYDAAVRLMVCDMVEPALQHTTDLRPGQAVAVARRYVRGEATREELVAARDAALDAALDAARDAAGASAWDDARDAAWVAARAAAGAATWDTARDAAWDAARVAAQIVDGDAARARQVEIYRQHMGAMT